MKCLPVLIPFLGLLYCTASVSGYFYEQSIDQTLIPIDQFDRRTWQNRFFIDDSYYTPGGPLFLSTGASISFASDAWLNYTHFFDMGREMNALLIYTEHRFFGHSRPTENLSMVNLSFLDTRYAVDDVANLVVRMREQYQTGPVICHGFDHGGAISVWLAHRHPHLVSGVWASSATINAVKDHSMYLNNVAEDIRVIGGQECYHQTELAFERMESLYATGNYQPLEEAFNLCSSFSPVPDDLEAFAFFATHAVALGSLIRYSHRMGVETLCEYYTSHDDPMAALASFIQAVLPVCVDIDPSTLTDDVVDESWDTEGNVIGMRQMLYQSCREFGWFISSAGTDHPFGSRFPLEIFQEQCSNIFGPIFTGPNMFTFVDQTNQILGGNRPNITNAYFTVGEYDPNKELGVLEPYRDTIHVDIIPDFGAGAEVLSSGTYPFEQIAAVQDRARELISQWIAEAN